MAPAQCPSSPLSTLSSLSSHSRRSPSPPRSHLTDDDIAQHASGEHLDTASDHQQHSTAAGQHESNEASDRGRRGDSAGDDDAKMSEVKGMGTGTGRARSTTVEMSGEGMSGEVVKEREREVMPEVDQEEVRSDIAGFEPPPPPLTPRSQRMLDSFDMRRVAYPRPSPPPPDRVVYQYFAALPYPNSGGHLVGIGGRTATDIRFSSGVGSFSVFIREDELAYVVIIGTRRAIQLALDMVKKIEGGDAAHGRRGSWERMRSQAAGSSWADYDEVNLERVGGWWLLDRFTDAAHDARTRNAPPYARDSSRQQGDAVPYGGQPVPSAWRNDSRASYPSATSRDYRIPPPERPASEARSSVRPDEYPRDEPSRTSARRRSSRSASPPRRSGRSDRSPSRSPPRSSSLSPPPSRIDTPRSSQAPRASRPGRSHRHDPSTTSSESVEHASSLSIPIPVSAIERFVGANAAGHFITQTTGVRLVVEAALDGTTLHLELGPGATSQSLVEARQLVEKVLASNGLGEQSGTRWSSVPRSSREDSRHRSGRECESDGHERGGGRDRRGRSRSREREGSRHEKGRGEGRGKGRRRDGRDETSRKEKGRDSRRRDERSYSPAPRSRQSADTRRAHRPRDDDRSTRPRSRSPTPTTASPRRSSTARTTAQLDHRPYDTVPHSQYATPRHAQHKSSSTSGRPPPREWDLQIERDRAYEAQDSRWGWQRGT
ncbi:hypothetical protein JCM3775_000849 [Rhodotorula graminis]